MKEEDCKKIVRQMCVGGLLIEELGIDHGRVIADIANLEGEVWYGYEIKTETDTLKRLPNQVLHYNKIFDYCYLFCHLKHVVEAEKLLPESWGIYTYTDDTDVTLKRPAKKNSSVDKMLIADLMWKAELMNVLRQANYKKISTLSAVNLRKLIVKNYTPEEIKLKTVESMKSRQTWKPLKFDYGE